MNRSSRIFLLLFSILFNSCSNDDDASSPLERFYDNALASATEAQLDGIWAIFNIGFDNQIAPVGEVYSQCGRDFFMYAQNGSYTEYLFQDGDCNFSSNTLNWELNNGVITLTNTFNQTDDLVITELTSNRLVFKARLDVDEDGMLDVITVYAERYQPMDIDTVTPSFTQNFDEDFQNLISYMWQPYIGFNEFNRYEIYRSIGDNCTTTNAELVATITDKDTTVFTDLNPPAEEYLCYFIRVYTNTGLLGQSELRSFWTGAIDVVPVSLHEPIVMGNTIQLNWDRSDDPYFSHYEIAYSNFEGNITGYGKQVSTITSIDAIDTTSYLDENTPYLENPFYMIYVYNIFGKRTFANNTSDVNTYWEVDYKRDEIIGLESVKSYALDEDESVIYLYGRESSSSLNLANIYKFNYVTNQMEAVSNLPSQLSTSIPIKLINSNGTKEIILEQGSELVVYDANTLQYKYNLDPDIFGGLDDFNYANGYWIITTNDDVYTFERDFANFELVDSKPHFPNHQGTFPYLVYPLNNNKLLVGHNNESQSYVYSMDGSGVLTQDQIVNVPVLGGSANKTVYNSEADYIINFEENRLYSTTSFGLITSFEQPQFPSGVSTNGDLLLGSNNNPDWSINAESLHAKAAKIFNRQTQSLQHINTIGYPHILFQTSNGTIYSLSSGLKKETISQNINNRSDLFIEHIQN